MCIRDSPPIQRFTADGAYDAESVYGALRARPKAPDRIVIPPQVGAIPGVVPNVTWPWRPLAIDRIAEVGRAAWRSESGYRQQARVENTMFRYKHIVGSRLRARCEDGRKVEAAAGCNVLNRMFDLGKPRSVRIASEVGA